MGEVRRPVQRVDDPAELRPGQVAEPFLAQEVVAGKEGRQSVMDQGLAGGIGFGDEVDFPLERHGSPPVKIPFLDVSGLPGDVPGRLEEIGYTRPCPDIIKDAPR